MDGSCVFGRPIVVDRCRGLDPSWLPARLGGGLGETRKKVDHKGRSECSGRALQVPQLGRLKRAEERVRRDFEEVAHVGDIRVEMDPNNIFRWRLEVLVSPPASSSMSGASWLIFHMMFPHYRYPANPPRLFSGPLFYFARIFHNSFFVTLYLL